MEEEGRCYWLRLQRDFFKRHDTLVIENMENGKDYLLFYLKLLVESLDHDGNLRFSDTIPYNEKMLAGLTNTNIDVVRSALKVFQELKMIEILDDRTIYMAELYKFIGSNISEEEKKLQNRERQKRYRDRQKQLIATENGNVPENENGCNVTVTLRNVTDNVTVTQNNAHIRDKILDNRVNSIDSKSLGSEEDKSSSLSHSGREKQEFYEEIIQHWNTLPSIVPKITKISGNGSRKRLVDARLKDYGIEEIHKAIEEIPKSKFLLGQGNKGWVIKFDWFILPSNFVKVLEGNYRGDIRIQSSGNAYMNAVENRMDVVNKFLDGGNRN